MSLFNRASIGLDTPIVDTIQCSTFVSPPHAPRTDAPVSLCTNILFTVLDTVGRPKIEHRLARTRSPIGTHPIMIDPIRFGGLAAQTIACLVCEDLNARHEKILRYPAKLTKSKTFLKSQAPAPSPTSHTFRYRSGDTLTGRAMTLIHTSPRRAELLPLLCLSSHLRTRTSPLANRRGHVHTLRS